MARLLFFLGLYVTIAYTGGYAWLQIHQNNHIPIADLSTRAHALIAGIYKPENNRFYRWRAPDGTWRYGPEPPTRQALVHTDDTDQPTKKANEIFRAVTKYFPELDYVANRQKGIDDAVNSAL